MIALSRTCNKIITSSSNFGFCAVLSSQFSDHRLVEQKGTVSVRIEIKVQEGIILEALASLFTPGHASPRMKILSRLSIVRFLE